MEAVPGIADATLHARPIRGRAVPDERSRPARAPYPRVASTMRSLGREETCDV